MSRAQHEQIKTGPEYNDLVTNAAEASAALKDHIFNVNKGPVPEDHPLRQASYAAHDAVLAHLHQHNPGASREAAIMDYTDPLYMKAVSDTSKRAK